MKIIIPVKDATEGFNILEEMFGGMEFILEDDKYFAYPFGKHKAPVILDMEEFDK